MYVYMYVCMYMYMYMYITLWCIYIYIYVVLALYIYYDFTCFTHTPAHICQQSCSPDPQGAYWIAYKLLWVVFVDDWQSKSLQVLLSGMEQAIAGAWAGCQRSTLRYINLLRVDWHRIAELPWCRETLPYQCCWSGQSPPTGRMTKSFFCPKFR